MKPCIPRCGRKCLSLAVGLASTWLAIEGLHAQTTVIPSTHALPISMAVTNQPGFIWNVSEVLNSEPNSLAWAEQQLQGLEGINYADPNGLGTNGMDGVTPITTGPAQAANPPTAPISFVITNVINLSRVSGSGFGNFKPDDGMPGIPGTGANNGTDNIAAEALTYLELPVGTNTIGVNSDDGFRLTIGGASPEDKFALNVGQFDGGRGSADTIFQVVIQKAGLYAARLLYENGGGDANVELFTILDGINGTNRVLVNDITNGGVPAYSAITLTSAYAKSVDPAPGANNVVPNEGIHIVMVDGSTPLATNSLALYLDGAAVSPSISRSGNLTSVDYNPASWTALSQHTVSFAYTDGTLRSTNTWSFVVQSYISLDPAWATTGVDTSKPGFNWNIFANSSTPANKANSVERAETDLTLQAVDSSGVPLPNNADPSKVGAAIGVGTTPPTDAPNAPVHFEIATVIQLDIAGCCTNMPGAPSLDGTTDGQAAEVVTYLNLPAGVVRMQIDADDGWRLYSGAQPSDLFSRTIVAERNGGAAGAVGFSFVVPTAGFYPFRLVWENGGGGSHLYWSSFTNGNPVFVNDVAHGGIAAYRAQVAGTAVKSTIIGTLPVPALHQMEVPSTNLSLVLVDGTASIDTNSVTLTIDGKNVTPVTTRQAKYVIVSDNGAGFTGLQLASDIHTATVTYSDSTRTNTQQFSFDNIEVLNLPTNPPVILEDFDKYPVASSPSTTVPPGWTAWNFTAENNAGWDITSKGSDSFKNWIIIDTTTLTTSIESGSLNNINTSQTINGQPITNFASGNVIWATSDGRSGVQAQFCTSSAFDLSSVTNPVMIYSSIMRMSAGGNAQADGIEYSIDSGNTWLPAIIYVTIAYDGEGAVLLLPNGDIDAVRTLNAPWSVLSWVNPTNGAAGGGTFGSGLAEPVTQGLAQYMAPRSDNTTLSSKVDGVRLPMASHQKDVRLRFYQLGNCSWWWGVDNLAFYDLAPPTSSLPGMPHIDSIQQQAGSVTIKWSNGGTLYSSPTLANPTWTSTGNSSGTFTEPIGAGAKFYRAKQ